MVENKHSVNTILSFGAKSVNPEVLEKLLIGREKNAEYLFNAVKSIAEDNNNQQIVVIGQRGMGKTHLFRILYSRIQKYITDQKLVVAYFSEEEYGVANYFDFLTRIINALIKWNDSDRDMLLSKLEELQETQPKSQVAVAEKIIEEYIGKRPLLILAENFGDILESIKPAEQSKLRAWLYKVNRISIIASSQAISSDFETEDKPFYSFFNIYNLKTLDFEGSLEFLKSLAKIDNRDDVVKHLENEGRAQVKAIHQLVKGNHRLLVTFYEFLKTDTLAKLSSHFIKTINDLKPYYESYIRYLPAQQQKILRYIALSRKPQQGTDISKNCFIEQKSLSKELSELNKKKLIEVLEDFDDKRNKLYDILEPLLRISIEVGEHREGITSLFIDFLAIYYNENELVNRKTKFSDSLSACENLTEKIQLNYEIQAIDKALELKKTNHKNIENKQLVLIDKIYELFDKKDWILAEKKLTNSKKELSKVDYAILLGEFYYLQNKLTKAIEVYKSAAMENQVNELLYRNWAVALGDLANINQDEKLFKESLVIYKKVAKINPKSYTTYYNWGGTLVEFAELTKDDSYAEEGLKKYEKAAKLNPKNYKIYTNWAYVLNNLAYQNHDLTLYEKSVEKLKLSIAINPEGGFAYNNLGNALSDMAFIKKDKELFYESYNSYFKAIELDKKHIKAFLNLIISLADYNFLFSLRPTEIDMFLKLMSKNLISEERINIYDLVQNVDNYLLFNNMWPIIEKDINHLLEKNGEILINWIINILSEKMNSFNSEKITFLKDIANKYKGAVAELGIVEKYLMTYEDYVIKGNKKSLYNLPKEQRSFFRDNILKKIK